MTPVPHVSSCTVALSSHMVTLASMVAGTVLATVLAKGPWRAGLGTHCSRPAWRAGTFASDVVAGASILAGAAQLTVSSMAPRGAQLLTVNACVARSAEALASARVTAGAMVALTEQLAALAVSTRSAEFLTAPASEARGAHAGAGDRVAQGAVLTLTPVAAVGTPVLAVTAAGAVRASPSRLTVAGIGRDTAAVHALLGTQRNAEVSVLIVARAALGPPPVHGPEAAPIRGLIADPVPGTLEPVEDVCTSCVVDLIKGVCIRLLHSHGIALPVATHIGVFRVQSKSSLQKEDKEAHRRRRHRGLLPWRAPGLGQPVARSYTPEPERLQVPRQERELRTAPSRAAGSGH